MLKIKMLKYCEYKKLWISFLKIVNDKLNVVSNE